MFVKICANTNVADTELAVKLEADAVGFVFAPSKRQVVAAKVAEITSQLPESVEKIGVFGGSAAAEIFGTTQVAGLTGVQLHGSFDARTTRMLAAVSQGRLKIIQTVPYIIDADDREDADEFFEHTLRSVFAESSVWAVLLDAARNGASGGLGLTYDWAHVAPRVRRIVEEARAQRADAPRLIIAGGLRPDNVQAAIAAFEPWGVDVASGVEVDPGRKDPSRLREFLLNAKGGDR